MHSGHSSHSEIQKQLTSEKDSSYQNLFVFIKKNKTLPALLKQIDDVKLQKLLNTIQNGDPDAEIFSDPNCYVYLLQLIARNDITFLQGMTVYAYLMLLMQFTHKQPLREEDSDAKFIKHVSVEKICDNYLKNVCDQFARINHPIDINEFKKYILTLPATETWLLTFEVDNSKLENEPENDCDKLAKTLWKNIPFLVAESIENNKIKYKTPSVTIINYLLKKISPNSVKFHFLFGAISKETLHKLHLQDQHPIPLYATAVKSNIKKVHSYRCGPFLAWLHDIGHTLWGTMLTERNVVLTKYVPRLELIKEQALLHQDKECVERIEMMVQKAIDFDLTDIRDYLIPEERLDIYLSRTLGPRIFRDKKGNLYGYCRGEFNKLGDCVEDRIFFLMLNQHHNTLSSPEETLWKMVFSNISDGAFIRQKPILGMIKILSANESIKANLSFLETGEDRSINWEKWHELLCKPENIKNSQTLWNAILASDLYFRGEFFTLIKYYNLLFFHPYIPMTTEKIKNFQKLVAAKINNNKINNKVSKLDYFSYSHRR